MSFISVAAACWPHCSGKCWSQAKRSLFSTKKQETWGEGYSCDLKELFHLSRPSFLYLWSEKNFLNRINSEHLKKNKGQFRKKKNILKFFFFIKSPAIQRQLLPFALQLGLGLWVSHRWTIWLPVSLPDEFGSWFPNGSDLLIALSYHF